jgi:predicted anti-sigma-YlaC factor YlaD
VRRGSPCRELVARLSEYLDREIDPQVCARIEEHLGDCAACRAVFESLRRTVGLVRGAKPSDALPEAVKRRIVEAFRRAERS